MKKIVTLVRKIAERKERERLEQIRKLRTNELLANIRHYNSKCEPHLRIDERIAHEKANRAA